MVIFNTMKNFLFKLASKEDSESIWEWRNDEVTREMSVNSEIIPWEIHKQWFDSVLKDPNRYLYVGYLKNKMIGVARFDKVDINPNCYEISINLAPFMRGQGFGKSFLKESIRIFFLEVIDAHSIVAEIKKVNKPSIKTFIESGFEQELNHKSFSRYRLFRKDKII